jgi:hypothetical protein
MSQQRRTQIERFLNEELTEGEAEELVQLIETDSQVSRLFDQIALESIFRLPNEHAASAAEAPVNPELETLIKRQLSLSRRAELWNLRTSAGDEPHTLFDKNERIVATAARTLRNAGGEHVTEDELPITIERVENQPPRFLISGNWPADYEPLGIKVKPAEYA